MGRPPAELRTAPVPLPPAEQEKTPLYLRRPLALLAPLLVIALAALGSFLMTPRVEEAVAVPPPLPLAEARPALQPPPAPPISPVSAAAIDKGDRERLLSILSKD